MGSPALHLVDPGAGRHPDLDAGWLEWLVAHIDPGWRPGEWDNRLGLFTGCLGQRTDGGVGLPHPLVPGGDPAPQRPLRPLPAGAGGLRPWRRGFRPGAPPGAVLPIGPGDLLGDGL